MDRLFQQERIDQILALVQKHGRVSVSELTELFGVSAVTIRNDLAQLENQKVLVRTHGGAMIRPDSNQEPAFLLRKELHLAEKERIGRAVAGMIHDGDSIFLDASTTAWQVARHIKEHRELTILTNGLYVALELGDCLGITVVMPGGILRSGSTSLIGDQSASILERYHIQKGFFGALGLTLQEGLTDLNQYEVELKRRMVERSKEVIAIVDSSKWGKVAFATFATLDQVDHIATDTQAPQEMVAAIKDWGIQVTIA